MPELPETETIARDLDRSVRGARIVNVVVTKPDVLRLVSAPEFRGRVVGATIDRSWRRAKMVVLDLSSGDRLVVQPRFTGALLVDGGDLDERERRYSTLALALDDGRALHYRDIRRLGTVSVMDREQWQRYSDSLGVEPLDLEFTPAYLSELFRVSRQAVKKLLMDQRLVVGVGNIYANEALWRARVHPARPGRSLAADDASRIHDDASGERGRFAERLAVYGRGGEPCPRCATALAETHDIDGRTTVFCASCQR